MSKKSRIKSRTWRRRKNQGKSERKIVRRKLSRSNTNFEGRVQNIELYGGGYITILGSATSGKAPRGCGSSVFQIHRVSWNLENI